MQIPLNLQHKQSIKVTESLTVPKVSPSFAGFADMPSVFATAFLVGFVEWTCIEAIKPYLSEDQRTVGIHVDLSHCAATPVGMEVTAEIELVEIDGKRLAFEVTCRDEVEVISTGRHERYIINAANFSKRVQQKLRKDDGFQPHH